MKTRPTLLLILLLMSLVISLQAQQSSDSKEFTFEEFERKLNQTSSPQILDVRTPQEYEENHLIGAINLPASEDAAFERSIGKLNKALPVFVYSINNGRSTTVSKKLLASGFTEVYQLPGGIAHWLGEGKPVESKHGKGISDNEFNQLVASNDLVLVSVGSKYCGGCKKLAPVVEEVEKCQKDLKVVRIELYDNRELAKTLAIQSVPTLILYKGSKPIWTKAGAITKTDILDALDNSL